MTQFTEQESKDFNESQLQLLELERFKAFCMAAFLILFTFFGFTFDISATIPELKPFWVLFRWFILFVGSGGIITMLLKIFSIQQRMRDLSIELSKNSELSN